MQKEKISVSHDNEHYQIDTKINFLRAGPAHRRHRAFDSHWHTGEKTRARASHWVAMEINKNKQKVNGGSEINSIPKWTPNKIYKPGGRELALG